MLVTLVALLAAAVLLVSLSRRLGFGSILGYLVAFAHMYFPGVGRVRKDSNHYRWIPVPYTNDATKY